MRPPPEEVRQCSRFPPNLTVKCVSAETCCGKEAGDTAPPPPPLVLKKAPRRPSTSVPVIRRNETESTGRPKRAIHPPPPKDLPYVDVPKMQCRRAVKKGASDEQLRYFWTGWGENNTLASSICSLGLLVRNKPFTCFTFLMAR
jgi:hypothetical protein